MSKAALLMLLGAAGAQPAAPLPPSGKWTVEFADSMCVAMREYGTPDDPLTLLLKPLPGDSNIEVMVVGGKKAERPNKAGETTVAVAPSGQTFGARYYDIFAPKLNRQLTQYYVRDVPVETLSAMTAIELPAGKTLLRAFALTDMARLQKVLDQCQDDLLRSWGLDPSVFETIATRAQMTAGSISDNDYPPGSKRNREQGTTIARWTVDTKGRPVDCRIMSSSGSPALDAATCSIILSRFRYKPALNRSGAPVTSLKSQRVHWRLP